MKIDLTNKAIAKKTGFSEDKDLKAKKPEKKAKPFNSSKKETLDKPNEFKKPEKVLETKKEGVQKDFKFQDKVKEVKLFCFASNRIGLSLISIGLFVIALISCIVLIAINKENNFELLLPLLIIIGLANLANFAIVIFDYFKLFKNDDIDKGDIEFRINYSYARIFSVTRIIAHFLATTISVGVLIGFLAFKPNFNATNFISFASFYYGIIGFLVFLNLVAISCSILTFVNPEYLIYRE
ncbi:MAG: hypothetical protein HUJ42_02240 [Malacoplasma sp.]|nr:hypothetical protein [Malacoplasma sp.]